LRSHEMLLDAQQALMDWEVPRALAHERLRLFAQLSPLTQTFLTRPQPSPARYDEALAQAASGRAGLAAHMAGLDGWIAPAAPGIAPLGLASTGDPVFNRLWTVLHVPCLSIPCLIWQGLPVGVQVIARDDATALTLAQFLETALKEVP
jgi:amidase